MRKNGIVKWFNEKKGFGFIEQLGGGEDLFVHHSAIEGKGFKVLNQGDEVEYEVAPGRNGKGPKAEGVKVLRAAK